jgi:hypothetical protein
MTCAIPLAQFDLSDLKNQSNIPKLSKKYAYIQTEKIKDFKIRYMAEIKIQIPLSYGTKTTMTYRKFKLFPTK